MPEPIRVESRDDGQIWRVWLNAPKANVIDKAMVESLDRTFKGAGSGLKAIIIQGEGEHFSFGASVPEHLPGQVETMLPAFHGLFRTMLGSRVVTLAAVRGQCLGGGLELAAACSRVFATPTARLGQPEIVLGVVAPVASVLLAERTGRGPALDLCLSGRTISGETALGLGLVDQLADDPGEAALAYATQHLLPRSASSLRFAVEAANLGFQDRFTQALDRAEDLYLTRLIHTQDATEGIRSFLEKRKPDWSNQ